MNTLTVINGPNVLIAGEDGFEPMVRLVNENQSVQLNIIAEQGPPGVPGPPGPPGSGGSGGGEDPGDLTLIFNNQLI